MSFYVSICYQIRRFMSSLVESTKRPFFDSIPTNHLFISLMNGHIVIIDRKNMSAALRAWLELYSEIFIIVVRSDDFTN